MRVLWFACRSTRLVASPRVQRCGRILTYGPILQGLPPGSGDAGKEEIGGEMRHVMATSGTPTKCRPIVLGNVTEDDIGVGNVASLKDPAAVRTTLMKVASGRHFGITSIARCLGMPPSLEADEVYALLAYILNLGYVVDDDFVLSDDTIHAAQARMPNRTVCVMIMACGRSTGAGCGQSEMRPIAS